MVAASPDQCTTSTMPTPISLFAESDECGAPGAHCAPTNDTALSGMSSPLLPCSADTVHTLTPRRQLAFLTTTDPLPPGSPLPQPATMCVPLRTTGLAAAAVIGSAAEMSTMDMADRSAATTPVSDDLGAACKKPAPTRPSPTSPCHLVCASGECRTGCEQKPLGFASHTCTHKHFHADTCARTRISYVCVCAAHSLVSCKADLGVDDAFQVSLCL